MIRHISIVLLLVAYSQAKSCGDDTVRGVNLGGWLLLEPWITPSVRCFLDTTYLLIFLRFPLTQKLILSDI